MPSTILIPRARRPLALVAAVGAMLSLSAGAQAEFTLNWQPQTANPAFNTLGCATPNACSVIHQDENSEIFRPGQTPFLYERVVLDGQNYYHLIVGDPDQGFAQEVFIRVGGAGFGDFQGASLGPADGAGGPLLNDTSSSLGQTPDFLSGVPLGFQSHAVNPLSPDRTFSGNTTANPERVQMRQLLQDRDLTVDFRKDRFLDKPDITNTIETGDFTATFRMDSEGNRYNDASTPSAVTNTVVHTSPDMPEDSRVFDMATDAQNPNVTAGRYTYTPATGQVANAFGGAGGTYQYAEGGNANPNPDWRSFFDHREANPWSYAYEPHDNRPTPP